MPQKNKDNRYLLQKYGGLAFQFIGGLVIGLFLGKYLDKKFLDGKVVLTWILPLVAIFVLLYALIRDVMKKG